MQTNFKFYLTFFGSLGWSLILAFPEQPFLTISYLHAVRVHFFKLAGMRKQFWIFLYRSVPLNIIIGLDNYTLRNGTERNKVNKCQNTNIVLLFKNNQLFKRIILSIIRLNRQLRIPPRRILKKKKKKKKTLDKKKNKRSSACSCSVHSYNAKQSSCRALVIAACCKGSLF